MTERRHTKNKEEILDLFRAHHVLTETDLVQKLPHMNPSTVYRNVRRFESDGVLVPVQVEEKQYFELADHGKHDHFVCDECHEVEELHLQRDTVLEGITNKHVHGVEIVVHGLCARCV